MDAIRNYAFIGILGILGIILVVSTIVAFTAKSARTAALASDTMKTLLGFCVGVAMSFMGVQA